MPPLAGWILGGAVACPALVIAFEYAPSPFWMRVAIGVAIGGLAAGGGIAAVLRGGRFWPSALIWGAAYASGIVAFALWPHYSPPLAMPGEINDVWTLGGEPPRRLPGSWIHAFWRVAVGLLLPAAIGGAIDGARLAGRTHRVRGGTSAAIGWAAGLVLLPPLLVAGIYATSALGTWLPVAGKVPAHLVGLTLAGMLCGAVIGAIGEHALQRSSA